MTRRRRRRKRKRIFSKAWLEDARGTLKRIRGEEDESSRKQSDDESVEMTRNIESDGGALSKESGDEEEESKRKQSDDEHVEMAKKKKSDGTELTEESGEDDESSRKQSDVESVEMTRNIESDDRELSEESEDLEESKSKQSHDERVEMTQKRQSDDRELSEESEDEDESKRKQSDNESVDMTRNIESDDGELTEESEDLEESKRKQSHDERVEMTQKRQSDDRELSEESEDEDESKRKQSDNESVDMTRNIESDDGELSEESEDLEESKSKQSHDERVEMTQKRQSDDRELSEESGEEYESSRKQSDDESVEMRRNMESDGGELSEESGEEEESKRKQSDSESVEMTRNIDSEVEKLSGDSEDEEESKRKQSDNESVEMTRNIESDDRELSEESEELEESKRKQSDNERVEMSKKRHSDDRELSEESGEEEESKRKQSDDESVEMAKGRESDDGELIEESGDEEDSNRKQTVNESVEMAQDTESDDGELIEESGMNSSKVHLNVEQKITFNIKYSDWQLIKPQGGSKLKSGWTDIFAQEFIKVMPTCSLSFKYHYITKPGRRFRNFFTAKASCKLKGCAEFTFNIKAEPEQRIEEDITVRCYISKGTISHTKKHIHKRQLRGEKRRQVARELGNVKPSEMMFKSMASMSKVELEFGNLTSCQTRNVLKNAAHEFNYGNVIHNDPLTELIIIKHALKETDIESESVTGYVQRTQLDPLVINLFNENQLQLLKEAKKYVLYIDATGTVVKSLPDSDKKLLYYAAVLNTKDMPPIPVLEFISAAQTTHTLTAALMDHRYFLNRFGCKNPIRCETDFSWAIIHACLSAYNQENINTYLQKVFTLLRQDRLGSKLNFTVVHICAAHMIKLVRNQLAKKVAKKRVLELLTKCFAVLQNGKNIKDVYLFWKDMLRVFVRTTASPSVLKRITDQTDAVEIDYSDAEVVIQENENTETTTIRKGSPFYAVFHDTFMKENEANDDKKVNDNPYFAQKAVLMLATQFMPLIPLWSGLLLEDGLTRDTNSSVENWFRIVKEDILGKKKRLRLGKFVLLLSKSLKGRLRSFVHDIHVDNRKKKNKDTHSKEDYYEAKENWQKTAKKPKSKYYTPKASMQPKQPADDNDQHTFPLNGIHNVRNICWLSSTLQSLAHQNITFRGYSDPLLTLIDSYLKKLRKKRSAILHIDDVVMNIENDNTLNKDLEIGEEQDAATFITLLLSRTHYKSDSLTSFITIAWQRKCTRCAHVAQMDDQMQLLPLALDQSMHHIVNKFLKRDVIHRVCNHCNAEMACSWPVISSPPHNLHIQLKRFRIDRKLGVVKDTRNTFINRFISIGNNAVYRLCSIQCHTGATIESGHYHTILVHSKGESVLCNDSIVKQKSPESILTDRVQCGAYIIHYQRLQIQQEDVLQYISICGEHMCVVHDEKYPVTKRDISRLKPHIWLNDQIINHYMSLVCRRANRNLVMVDTFASAHKVVDVLSQEQRNETELVLKAVHSGSHWSLLVIQVQDHELHLFDSGSSHSKHTVMDILERLKSKSQDWKLVIEKNIPKQTNTHDCGVFVCEFAKCCARDGLFYFSQDDMPQIRKRIILEVLSGRLIFSNST